MPAAQSPTEAPRGGDPRPSGARGKGAAQGAPLPAGASRARRRWLFRIAAATLIPLLVLLGLELALRLFGYGHSTSLFLQAEIGGRRCLVDNSKFTQLFFPPALARHPLPTVLQGSKPPGAFRIFLLGESAVKGEPDPAFSFARILKVLLEARFKDRRFEVVNLGITAVNSHVILRIAREIAPLESDLWIVYMGNNEVLGPFGPRSIFGARAPSLGIVRAALVLKATRAAQLLEAILRGLGVKGGSEEAWRGMEMFLQQQVRQDDPELERVYRSFRGNLTDILEAGASSGAKVILSTVVANLKDCAPFASLHPAALPAEKLKEWEALYQEGARLEALRDFKGALDTLALASSIDASHAELHYRMARCFWAVDKYDDARRHYVLARDLDTIRFRADSRINETIREVARARPRDGLRFVDAEEIFARQSPHGVVGEDLLYEHVHFNFEGNYLLATALADQVAGVLGDPGSVGGNRGDTGQPGWLAKEDCARELALSPWERFEMTRTVRVRLSKPPYSTQLNHPERDGRLGKALEELEQSAKKMGLDAHVDFYRRALAKDPADWMLHEKLGTFLAMYRRNDEAKAEFQKVLESVPHHAVARCKLGLVHCYEKDYAEALKHFALAVELEPHFYEAIKCTGLVLAEQGKHAMACEEFRRAARIEPDAAEAQVHWGSSLESLGSLDDARAHYQKALDIDPEHAEANLRLAKLLEGRKKHEEAASRYEKVLQRDPRSPEAHHGLGRALVAGGKAEEGLKHYEEALRIRPGFAEAHLDLGLLLLESSPPEPSRLREAARHFLEALRLDPRNERASAGLAKARDLYRNLQGSEEKRDGR